jgi:hypothetical protein
VVAWLKSRSWLLAAIGLGMGLPVIVVAVTSGAVASAWFIQTRITSSDTPLSPWLWVVTFAIIAVASWLLVAWCVRVGGWRTLGFGLGVAALLALCSSALGSLQARMYPGNGMAGVGAGILAWLIGACAVVVFAMGAIVIGFDRWRASRGSAAAESGIARPSD